MGDEEINSCCNKFFHQLRESIIPSFCPPKLDENIPTLNVTESTLAGRELVAVPAAVTVMKSDPMPIHVDGFTRTTSEQGCFVFKGAKGSGLAAVGSGLVTLGLVEPFLVGITHTRLTAVGRSGGRRRTRAVPKGLTARSG